jgi:putative GTP pyrophosphokinase
MTYSKSVVNRAGRTLAKQMLATEDPPSVGPAAELREAIEIVEWWRSEHAKPLSRVAANLRYYVADHGKPVVAQRLKRVPTIGDKLRRESGMQLARMEDVGGVRAILSDQEASFEVASRLRKNWTITRFRDYVSEPKPDGYRALHLINRNRGRLIEVQLRTPRQDRWANAVEAFARISPGLKFGAGPRELREYFLVLGEFWAVRDQGRDAEIGDALLSRMEELVKQADTFLKDRSNEP